MLILTGSINLAKFLCLCLSQFGIFFLVCAHQSVLHSLKGSFKIYVGFYCSGRHIPFNCILRQRGRCIKLNFLISRVCFCSWNSKIWRSSSTLIRQTNDSTCRVNVPKWMRTSGLYYHLVHMRRVVPGSFLLGQTRQGEYTSGRWRCGAPLTSEAPNAFASPHKPTPACQNAMKHEYGNRWRGVVASAQMAGACSRLCVRSFFLRQWSLTGMAVSQCEVWYQLGGGMKGWRIEG